MLKHIPQSWKDDMRTNFAHKHDFYINPRGRVLPALTSAGISYIKNDATTNMRGTYRMQCGASTDLTYLYTMPQRFIIEGWFKPEFAYNVAGYQVLFRDGSLSAYLLYNRDVDKLSWATIPGSSILTTAFTSDAELQKWIYVRCFFDNTAKLKGFYCTVNGVVYADSQNVPGAGGFTPLNTISFMPTVAAESSYWIIHELDETLATGEYKTYQADRQIIFDFNGTTLGRERIRIPTIHTAIEHRGVQSFSLSKSVENPMTGSAGANTASMKLLNVNGQFSDDQYDAFDPFQGRYNGTEKYLQNRVPFEIESTYSRNGGLYDIPNGTPDYLNTYFTSADGWTAVRCTLSYSGGKMIVTATDVNPAIYRAVTASRTVRMKVRRLAGVATISYILTNGGTVYSSTSNYSENPHVHSLDVGAGAAGSILLYPGTTGSAAGDIYEISWIYIGDKSELTDPMSEPLFIGRTTPGAFRRNSPSRFYGDVSIDIEDGISELGETKLRRAYAFDSYDLCDPAAEGDSLVHSIARLVTKKEIRNYAFNSSFENATIANSWAAGGLTLTRDNTYAQFGTYSAKCVSSAINQYFIQEINFLADDKIDVGDAFNFSAFIRQGTADSVKLRIYEVDAGGSVLAHYEDSATSDTTDVFERFNVSLEVQNPLCVRLYIYPIVTMASTFYVDGVMLTRGVDPIDYFLVNTTDRVDAGGSSDFAATVEYDTVAFDCDAVDVEHPYALVDRGSTAWDALKKIGDASIASYIGMSPDGVFQFRVRYNSDDMPNLGDVEDFGGIATSLDVEGANAIKVHGVVIQNPEVKTETLWTASEAAGFSCDAGKNPEHPISSATFMQVYGAETIEMKYAED